LTITKRNACNQTISIKSLRVRITLLINPKRFFKKTTITTAIIIVALKHEYNINN